MLKLQDRVPVMRVVYPERNNEVTGEEIGAAAVTNTGSSSTNSNQQKMKLVLSIAFNIVIIL